MARKPWLLRLLTWTSSIPIASSSVVGLGNDITSVVPTCAQSCLQSFISSNYPTTDCGTDSDLSCLCSTQSVSGFTVGEAALQCLLGYAEIGRCGEQYVEGSTPANVYNICSGQANALPNTHPVITATFIVPPSGDPSLLPPSPQTTTRVSSTSSSQTTQSGSVTPSQTAQPVSSTSPTARPVSTTTSQPTQSSSTTSSQTAQPESTTSTTQQPSTITTPAPTTLRTSTTSPNSSMATTGVVTSLPTSTPTAEPSSTSRLAPAQIAGISVGAAGAIGLAVGAIFLARCMRRRRYPNSDSEKGFYHNDNSTDSFDPLDSRTSRIFHISPPVLGSSRYRPEFDPRLAPPTLRGVPPEMPTQPTNTDKDTIGLAISRPRSLARPKSFLQPQSPAFSTPPLIEEPVERKNSRLLPPRPNLTLDIPPEAAAAAASSSQAAPAADRMSSMSNMTAFADLDSAAAEGAQVWRPPSSDPLSATTLYFADKHGNWVLSNNHRRSRTAQIIEAAGSRASLLSTKSPTEKQKEATNAAGSISTASALPRASQPAVLSQSPTSRENSQSSSLYSQPAAAQQSQSGRKNSSSTNRVSTSRRGVGGLSLDRSDSVTTIQSTSSGWNDNWVTYDDDDDVARLSQLSPVEESPNPATGRPRVNYPKIPGRLDGATIRFVPPPKRPNFEDLRSGQRSSTLGVVYPGQESPPAYPPPLNPKRNERRLAPTQRNGSGFSPELPNIEVFPLQNYSHANEMSRPRPNPSVYSQHRDTYDLPSQRHIHTSTTPPLSFAEQRSLTPPQPGNTHRNPTHTASRRAGPDPSFGAAGPATSSLLAKRVGSDKAAALTLGPNRPKAQRWIQQDNHDGMLTPDASAFESSRGTLPQTPMWQPRLTPTRQGDDLFLNVQ
ncbi:hypothetical protein F4861DRAFT_252059 [Xylaria intraflava]|nr:hypothetical protein F4861DRAFT_252059 [Xylaria intraflava]